VATVGAALPTATSSATQWWLLMADRHSLIKTGLTGWDSQRALRASHADDALHVSIDVMHVSMAQPVLIDTELPR